MSLKQKIMKNLTIRAKTELTNTKIAYLRSADFSELEDFIIGTVYLFTRPKRKSNQPLYFSEVIAALGHGINRALKMPMDSANAVRIGAFVMYTFELMGMTKIKLSQGKSGHGTYIIDVIDDDSIVKMYRTLKLERTPKVPSTTPFAPWSSVIHETGMKMVKTGSSSVLGQITPATHPMLFDALNRAQAVGWVINREIYNLQQWAYTAKAAAFNQIWEEPNIESRKSKQRDASTIMDISKRFLSKTFYH